MLHLRVHLDGMHILDDIVARLTDWERAGTSVPPCSTSSANTTARSPTATGCWRWSPGTSVRLQASASSRRAASRHAQAIVNCSVGDSAARLEFALINQSRRSIAVLDFMMWVTVLGCLIISGLLAWALARTINYLLHRSRR